jgi:hypothetical protein
MTRVQWDMMDGSLCDTPPPNHPFHSLLPLHHSKLLLPLHFPSPLLPSGHQPHPAHPSWATQLRMAAVMKALAVASLVSARAQPHRNTTGIVLFGTAFPFSVSV